MRLMLHRLLCLLVPLLPALGWAGDAEQRLMAVYLGRFAEYVQFAPEQQAKADFVIAVLGPDPFGGELQQLYQDRRIHKKPVRIVLAEQLQDLPPSDLLYINLPTQTARAAAVQYAAEQQLLSISNSRGFAAQGGIIQISFVEQKAKIIINHGAALRSGLQIRAPLLSIATLWQGEHP